MAYIGNVSAFESVGTSELEDSSVIAAKIATSAITTAKVAASAITTDKVAASAITTAKVADGAITAAKINSSVSTVKSFGTDIIFGGGFNSASYTATGCKVTLNRTAGTKCLIWFSGGTMYNTVEVFTTIKRGSVDLGRTASSAGGTGSGSGLQRFVNNYSSHAISTIDAATNISGSTVYEVYAKNTSSAVWEMSHNNWSGQATLIVMEIG